VIAILGDIFSLITMLIAVAVILYLSYIVSRKVGGGSISSGMSGNIKVLDRAFVGRDKSVVIVRVGQKDYLLGVSQDSVRLLQELEEGQVVPNERMAQEADPLENVSRFAAVIKDKMGKGKEE
jgi:flagellar protein FliO/FliZ